MKIVHILKKKPDPLTNKIIYEQMKGHEVTLIDLAAGFSAEELLRSVEEADKVFCW